MPSLIPCNFPQSPLPASCQGGLRRPVEPLAGILTPLLKQHFLCWWRGNKALFLSFLSISLASQQTGAVCWWVWHFSTIWGKDDSWDWQVLVISWIKALVQQTDPNHICVWPSCIVVLFCYWCFVCSAASHCHNPAQSPPYAKCLVIIRHIRRSAR